MATEAWLLPVVTALLSGGLVGGFSQIINARNAAKQIRMEEEKAPTDVGMVLLGGASQAVTVLTNSLQWAQGELRELKQEQAADKQLIRELMASNSAKDGRIAEMERELGSLRIQVAEIQTALDRAHLRIQEMRGYSSEGGEVV